MSKKIPGYISAPGYSSDPLPGGGLRDPLGELVDHLGAGDQIGLLLGHRGKGLEARAARTASVRSSKA